jgi:beta-lactamase class D
MNRRARPGNIHRLLVTLSLLAAIPAWAETRVDWQDQPGLGDLFAEAGVDGTFVSCRQPDGVVTGYAPERAMRRYPPASTFKIPHTLIALDAGVVSGPDELFVWDGSPRSFRIWERDMSLAEALLASNVPVYQQIAVRVGRERMLAQLSAFDYGNKAVGNSLIDFWLIGPLEISAVEQCRFLLRLAAGQLPVSDDALLALRHTLASDAGQGVTLYAKTGWANALEPDLGWWVGWVEGPFGRAAFALNIDMPDASFVERRIELGRKALKQLGLLPD